MTTISSKPDLGFLFSHPAHCIALGFGSGLAPKAPGTFGTLAALPLYALLNIFLSPVWIAALCLPFFFLGGWAANKTCTDLAVPDHGGVVIDEIVAMWLVLAAAPMTLTGWGAAFVLFRLFDIVKPWPISWLDTHVSGGVGVMLDDVAAALFSVLGLWVLNAMLPHWFDRLFL